MLNGVRFWIKSRIKSAGSIDRLSMNPFEGVPGECFFPNIMYKGKPLFIRGELTIDDPDICKMLIKDPGLLQHDPKQAAEFLSGKPQASENNVKAPKPELGAMSKAELIEYAGKQGYSVDMRKGRDKILAEIHAQEESEK